MGLFILALAVVAYLVLLVDWNEFLGAFGKGGWPSVALYAFLAVMIVMILTNPDIPHIAPVGHH
jgi:hypothetical protein